jgi:hypothetical protein
MKSNILLAIVLLVSAIQISSCRPPSSPTPTAIQNKFRKSPEPHKPIISGTNFGLPNDGSVAIVKVLLPSGEEVLWGKRGNGTWEFVVTSTGGAKKVVVAEAEGYISDPSSYTIFITDEAAFLVVDGEVTEIEATNLDFRFKQK